MKEPGRSAKRRGKQGVDPFLEGFPDPILDALLRAAYGSDRPVRKPAPPQKPNGFIDIEPFPSRND